jgi:transcription antitermination factor NusG
MSEWFVIQTSPQHELDAAEALRDLGFQIYCPTITKKRRKGKREKLAALFPRYIFCHHWIPTRDETDDIRNKAGRRMITGSITVCGGHEPISDDVIGKIAEAAARIDMDLDKPRRPLLKAGDIGIIKSGPMEGKSGEIVAISRGEAEIALKIFNAIRIVRARVETLEAAE